MTAHESTSTSRFFAEIAHLMFGSVRSCASKWVRFTLCALLLSCVLAPYGASAQGPVQWPIGEGGNGHWYQRVTTESEISWTDADTYARAAGGHLLTITSATEAAWTFSRFVAGQPTCSPGSWALARSIWIGLFQDPNDPNFGEPGGGWRWVTGEPLRYTNWAAGEPDNGDGVGAYAGMYVTGAWDDISPDAGIFCFKGYVIEWSADCDGDGEIDLGQILSGQLEDVNGNGLLDCCEGADTPTDDCNGNDVLDACELEAPGADSDSDRVLDACERAFGDFNLDGEIGAADLSLLLSLWASTAPPFGDLDGDGEVGAADLSLLLAKWGQSPPWAAPTISSVSPNSGPVAGGTPITIVGTNLTGTTAVTVGGTAASAVVVVNSTTVTAVTPSGTAGAKPVSVTTPGGTATASNGFTYTTLWYTVLEQNPNPTIVPSLSHRNAIIATGYPWRVRDNGTQIEMVLIPPGSFLMGCSASDAYTCDSNENPTRTVVLTDAFYLGRFEVTQSQWQSRMGSNPSYHQGTGYPNAANRPVEQVSWNTVAGISGFLTGTGLRLPSEAEWEYAYRAGTSSAFHGFAGSLDGTNDDTLIGSIAWWQGNAGNQTQVVGQKASNGFGLHDMAGNVREWVQDYWSYPSSSATAINPAGPSSGDARVIRGGALNLSPHFSRASDRDGNTPDTSRSVWGFRVARTVAPQPFVVSPNVGPLSGGTLVTITGPNLAGASGVTIDGAPATSLTIVDSTTVTVLTPAGTVGGKNVSVTSSIGTLSVTNGYFYAVAPTISSITPNLGPTFGGTGITITGTNLSGISAVLIQGVAATSVVALNETTVKAMTPPGSVGSKSVSLSTPGGSASLASAFTYTAAWYTILEQSPDPLVVTNPTLRNAIVATGFPWRVRDINTQIEMLLIPPGTFNMGCSASMEHACESDENPVHLVTITSPFYLGRYEVTQAQWVSRMGFNPSYFQSASTQVPSGQVSSRPVDRVSWDMIVGPGGYFVGTGLRLPTEGEWEFACRAGTTTAFHGFAGNSGGTNDDSLAGNVAWFIPNSNSQTRPVGGKLANGFGLYDMSGNVWEWVSDWFSSNYYQSSPTNNPSGPSTGTSRVQRGGSFNAFSNGIRSSDRLSSPPSFATIDYGFRVARNPL